MIQSMYVCIHSIYQNLNSICDKVELAIQKLKNSFVCNVWGWQNCIVELFGVVSLHLRVGVFFVSFWL